MVDVKLVNKHALTQKHLSVLRELHALPVLGEVVRLHAWRVKVNRPTLHSMMGLESQRPMKKNMGVHNCRLQMSDNLIVKPFTSDWLGSHDTNPHE